MRYTAEKAGTINLLGKLGEHRARELAFPEIGAWEAEYGPGQVEIIFLPPKEEKPISITPTRTEDGIWLWAATAAETACPGYGKCELRYTAGGAVVKSVTYQTYVAESLPVPKTGLDDVQREGPAGVLRLTDEESGKSYILAMNSPAMQTITQAIRGEI